MQIHYCIIHPLREFRNPIVRIRLRTTYLLLTNFFYNTVIRELSYVPINSSAYFTYQLTFPYIRSFSTILHQANTLLPNNSLVHVMTVSPKNWRPKAKHNYEPINYKDIDDDLYVLNFFDKAMKQSPTWTPRPRTDLILWNESSFLTELYYYQAVNFHYH